MTLSVKIYQPPKSTMQSGRAKGKAWVLEYDLATKRAPNPLMGWIASGDTLNQVKMSFNTQEEAIAFAQKKGWAVEVIPTPQRHVKGRTYMDNFKYVPVQNEK